MDSVKLTLSSLVLNFPFPISPFQFASSVFKLVMQISC